MIDKAANGFIMHCDNCSNAIHITYARNYNQVYESAKESGWINRTIDGEWHNFCSEECYEERKAI